jgi:DNA mismatch repair protein MutS2
VFTLAIEKLRFTVVIEHIKRYAHSELGIGKLDECHPTDDIDVMRRNLDLLDEMKRVLEGEDPVPMHGIRDIREAVHRAGIEGNALTGKELRYIYDTLYSARMLHGYFKTREEKYPRMGKLVRNLTADKVVEYNIDSIVNEEGEVKDSASSDLQEIRHSIRSVSETLRKRLERIVKNLAAERMAQEELITTRDGRMVVPVKSEYKHIVPGFIHSSSASGATVFIEPAETLEINNELREYHISEQREIDRLLRMLTAKIAERKQELLMTVEILAEIDFLNAKGQYSIEILGTRPQESADRAIRLADARHPLLLLHHRRDSVIPLTLTLGDTFYTLIVTGPNAGGKSVAMQTVGLLCLMYQSGLHIPAHSDSELPVFKNIFVSMGDEQSIEHDLSTFSSHLLTLKSILAGAEDRSLVLIDEIAAGTDPVEGSALAAALLGYLTEKKTVTIATTHHGDLKAFAFEQDYIENGAMEFDQKTLTPTYHFTVGIPGSSYALEIAQRLGFSPHILENAKNYLGSTQGRIEGLLVNLEQQSQDYKRQLDTIRVEKERLEIMTKEYEQKLSGLKKEIKDLKVQAAREAREIIDRANAVIEKAVKDIRESAGSAEVARQWRDEVKVIKSDLENTIQPSIPETTAPPTPLKKGDRVVYEEGDQIGEVIEVIGDGNYILVLFGAVKLQVPSNKLRKTTGKEKIQTRYESTLNQVDIGIVPHSVDVRGLSGDEAISTVDLFLDRALLAGYESVDIIHGKGTGALRKRITEYLKKNPRIISIRLGNWNEGGSGVTVAELRR